MNTKEIGQVSLLVASAIFALAFVASSSYHILCKPKNLTICQYFTILDWIFLGIAITFNLTYNIWLYKKVK